MNFKSTFTLILIIGTFLFVSCGSREIKISCGISDITQAGINHLEKLTDAMEEYKNDNGKYPENVVDLIPRYIEKITVVNTSAEGFDKTKYDVLQIEKLSASGPFIKDNGNYFNIRLYPIDDRICLTGGKNNYCEYTSDTKKWSCY